MNDAERRTLIREGLIGLGFLVLVVIAVITVMIPEIQDERPLEQPTPSTTDAGTPTES